MRQLEGAGLKRVIYLHVVPTIGAVLTVNLQYPGKSGHVGVPEVGPELLNEGRPGIL